MTGSDNILEFRGGPNQGLRAALREEGWIDVSPGVMRIVLENDEGPLHAWLKLGADDALLATPLQKEDSGESREQYVDRVALLFPDGDGAVGARDGVLYATRSIHLDPDVWWPPILTIFAMGLAESFPIEPSTRKFHLTWRPFD